MSHAKNGTIMLIIYYGNTLDTLPVILW